jgi:hypothetical protein
MHWPADTPFPPAPGRTGTALQPLPVAVLDIREMQRNVLAATFPDWQVTYGLDLFGALLWCADLRHPINLDMATAGVVRRMEAPDPIRLAALLAAQGALLARSHLPSGQFSGPAT